jgi:hypothetical protein
MSFSFGLIVVAGLIGLGVLIVGVVLVIWAIVNDRRTRKED